MKGGLEKQLREKRMKKVRMCFILMGIYFIKFMVLYSTPNA